LDSTLKIDPGGERRGREGRESRNAQIQSWQAYYAGGVGEVAGCVNSIITVGSVIFDDPVR